MADLIPIWNSNDLAGAKAPSPFTIPNNPNARGMKINNQSQYWLLLQKTSTGQNADRIEPYSYVTMAFEADLSLVVDTTSGAVTSSLTADKQFVDYTTYNFPVSFQKGSTMFSGSAPVTINGGVDITNSTLDVSVQSMPQVIIESGTINVPSATVVNEQLTVAQIYNAKSTYSIPAGTGYNNPAILNYAFLPNGTLANVHHVDFYITSANGYTYEVKGGGAFVTFSDGRQFNANPAWSTIYNAANEYAFDGNAVLCNDIQFQLGLANHAITTAAADTITVYMAIDCNETSIGTIDGVPVKPYSHTLKDASGSITTAGVAQQIIEAIIPSHYIFFQNVSGSDMWIRFGATSAQAGGAGSIFIPANGGSFVMEGTFTSQDIVTVICNTAGANYTFIYY